MLEEDRNLKNPPPQKNNFVKSPNFMTKLSAHATNQKIAKGFQSGQNNCRPKFECPIRLQ
jgi:hypothetical protein